MKEQGDEKETENNPADPEPPLEGLIQRGGYGLVLTEHKARTRSLFAIAHPNPIGTYIHIQGDH